MMPSAVERAALMRLSLAALAPLLLRLTSDQERSVVGSSLSGTRQRAGRLTQGTTAPERCSDVFKLRRQTKCEATKRSRSASARTALKENVRNAPRALGWNTWLGEFTSHQCLSFREAFFFQR